jgi:hypothetical protein
MEDFKDKNATNELFPNLSATEKEGLANVNVNFDTKSGKISVKTEAKDKNNLPLLEW